MLTNVPKSALLFLLSDIRKNFKAQGSLTSMSKSNDLEPVLCKYLGLTECGENGSNREVRLAPFKDGTFRATQPCALNDVLSETKCLSHFSTFSPADIKVTREKLKLENWPPNFEPTENDILRELKNSYNSESYTQDRFPALFDGPAVSKGEFEESEFLQAISVVNDNIIKIPLSQSLTILQIGFILVIFPAQCG